MTGRQWVKVITKTSYIPKISHHHQGHPIIRPPGWRGTTINRFSISGQQIWVLEYTKTNMVLCVLVLTGFQLQCLTQLFHFRCSSTPSYLRKNLLEFLYFSDINFWIFFYYLYQEEEKNQDEKTETVKVLREDIAGYTGRSEGKLVHLEHGGQKKTLCKKQAGTIYISEGLSGHDKDFGFCYFHKFCHSHGESIFL